MTGSSSSRIFAVVVLLTAPVRTVWSADSSRTVSTGAVRRIVVSIPDRKLALIEDDRVVSVYEVAVGAPASPSPTGTFSIVTRVSNPTYYRPGRVVGPGASNPIGTRWIGLNQKGYGIHGTDDPRSIGFAKSHGCIRLRNADVEKLFERVRPGDVVELHEERPPAFSEVFAGPHSTAGQVASR